MWSMCWNIIGFSQEKSTFIFPLGNSSLFLCYMSLIFYFFYKSLSTWKAQLVYRIHLKLSLKKKDTSVFENWVLSKRPRMICKYGNCEMVQGCLVIEGWYSCSKGNYPKIRTTQVVLDWIFELPIFQWPN